MFGSGNDEAFIEKTGWLPVSLQIIWLRERAESIHTEFPALWQDCLYTRVDKLRISMNKARFKMAGQRPFGHKEAHPLL